MNSIKRSGFSMKNKLSSLLQSSRKGFEHVGSAQFLSLVTKISVIGEFSKRVMTNSVYKGEAALDVSKMTKAGRQLSGRTQHALTYRSLFHTVTRCGDTLRNPYSVRCFASKASEQKRSETRKEVSTIEDPFDAPTYNIPDKPVTFTEGASYSLIILAGLGVAGVAAYGVFSELIFKPKEYKIFNKALKRIQDDGQVKVRIGSPITGYGSESRNRTARQRIPHKTWKDEEGVEHIVVNFHIRGPHGGGKVFSEMFKDKVDNQWKFMYLIVEVTDPHPAQLMLESYLPS